MGAVFPFVVSLLSGLVSSTVVKAMLIRVGVALGISAVTYTGIHVAFSALQTHIQSAMSGITSSTAIFLSMCHIPQAFSVVLSAYAGALTLRGLTSLGAITKVGISTPGAAFSPGTF